MSYTLQAQGQGGQRQGDIGWGVSDQEYENGDAQRSGYVSYRAPQALLRAEVDQSGDQWRGSFEAQGSILALGGSAFLANRIGDGFVVVRNAGPGAEVIQGGVRMGKANGQGNFLLPDVPPYFEQQVFIDPATLPDGWMPDATERTAVTAYRRGAVLDFGTRKISAAMLVIRDAEGKPIPAGYTVNLDNGASALMGYDGETYMMGLLPDNRLSIDLGPRGVCTARFSYDSDRAAQPKIGPLTCK
jgi:outer membrane usher protein